MNDQSFRKVEVRQKDLTEIKSDPVPMGKTSLFDFRKKERSWNCLIRKVLVRRRLENNGSFRGGNIILDVRSTTTRLYYCSSRLGSEMSFPSIYNLSGLLNMSQCTD